MNLLKRVSEHPQNLNRACAAFSILMLLAAGVQGVFLVVMWSGGRPLLALLGAVCAVLCAAAAVLGRSAAARLRAAGCEAAETERQRLAAEAASRAKSVFLANLSHEIGTSMNAICDMADLLPDETLSPAGREYAAAIRTSGEGLLGMMNDVQDFYKVESGEAAIAPSEYYFASMIHDVMSMMELRVKGKPVRLVTEIQSDIPRELRGDVGRIKQILINIIGNAAKFTHEGTVLLRVTWTPEGEGAVRLTASVLDTGIGIRPEDLEQLFAPFGRADEQRNLGLRGAGLGLPLAKLLVERMGGTIQAESEYGKGSIFTFSIPQQVVDAAPCAYDTGRETAEFKSFEIRFTAPQAKIMVVDDNEINLRVVQDLLQKFGVTPELVGSGMDCLVRLWTQPDYDLIFMDHMMPEMNGIEVAQKIRSLGDGYTSIPIVALSANAVKGAEQEFLAGGMDDFLTKPIELQALSGILEKWLPEEKLIRRADT